MINSWSVTGNLGQDPKYTPNPAEPTRSRVNFSIALSQGKRSEDKPPLWVSCVAWGHTADFISTHAKKGTKLLLIGEAGLETYEKKDGSGTVTNLAMVVRNAEVMGALERNADAGASMGASAAPTHNAADPDLPF